MRDYTPVDPSSLPKVVDIDFQPRLRRMLHNIDYFLEDVSRGFARIQNGQTPNGSGTSIIFNNPVLDDYFFLPGRTGGQVAYGGRNSSDWAYIVGTSYSPTPNDGHPKVVLETQVFNGFGATSALVLYGRNSSGLHYLTYGTPGVGEISQTSTVPTTGNWIVEASTGKTWIGGLDPTNAAMGIARLNLRNDLLWTSGAFGAQLGLLTEAAGASAVAAIQARVAQDSLGWYPLAITGSRTGVTNTGRGALGITINDLGAETFTIATGFKMRLCGMTTNFVRQTGNTLDVDFTTINLNGTVGGTITGAGSLSKTDDTNVTVTLGGSPNGALLKNVSLLLGWNGRLALARGGAGTAGEMGAAGTLFQSTGTTGSWVSLATAGIQKTATTKQYIAVVTGTGQSGTETVSLPEGAGHYIVSVAVFCHTVDLVHITTVDTKVNFPGPITNHTVVLTSGLLLDSATRQASGILVAFIGGTSIDVTYSSTVQSGTSTAKYSAYFAFEKVAS